MQTLRISLSLVFLTYGALQVSAVFQYPPVVRAEVGSTVHFTCDIGDLTGHCYSVLWLKVQPSRVPALAVYSNISPGGSRGSEADAPTKKRCSLTLTSVQVNDSGTYYCGFSSQIMVYYGNGTRLLVKSSEAISIVISSPSDDEVQSSGSVTLVCLVFGVSEQARVHWDIAGGVRHGLTDSDSTPDFIRNQITIQGEVWMSGTVCTCVVETESGRNVSRSVSKTGNKNEIGHSGARLSSGSKLREQEREEVQYASLDFNARGRK
ncbi:immunoglobulin kappa light chain-like isoform X2 [Polyodon spathula]|uniref:immunoglobulin kappa light chain-like isoform X2 n=1 Tax=Polyodon spathula TaxID=7913 RepID=UPI001B7E60A0|nr:immunoglobulin kappa light chain-like isoform X2 [Polyodon spathula]